MSNADHLSPQIPLGSINRPLAHEGIRLRILMVIDGRVMFNHDPSTFGLGFIVDTLRANWSGVVRIELALVTREKNIDNFERGGFEVHTGFRFDQRKFEIDDWDQIWIFADQPSQSDDTVASDSLITEENALSDEEARLLAEWMDRGGGLFATGDHTNLGAAVCHRIPRVRTMRKWRIADGVPTRVGAQSNRTLQGNTSDAESDLVLQPLELVYTQSVHGLPFQFVDRPHPIMCSPEGPINRFPDHMHEGELVRDADVQLDRPLDIPNYTRPEYPQAVPEVLARMIGMETTIAWRPRPSIIAYGQTTNRTYYHPSDEREASFIESPNRGFKRFGVVGVYDGDAAKIGRIVCDSTWHHWFSLNVSAIAEGDVPAYRMMQSYYRNIVLWLAKLTQRQRALTATVWNVLAHSSPMDFTARQTHWEMGERATELIAPILGPCWVNELVASQFNAAALYRVRKPEDPHQRPEWTRVPEGLVNKGVIGSLAKSLYPLANQLRLDRMRKSDVHVDSESIEALAKAGIAQVPTLLKETLATAIDSMTSLRESLDVDDGMSKCP